MTITYLEIICSYCNETYNHRTYMGDELIAESKTIQPVQFDEFVQSHGICKPCQEIEYEKLELLCKNYDGLNKEE